MLGLEYGLLCALFDAIGFYVYVRIREWLFFGMNYIGSNRKPTKPIKPTKTNGNVLLDFYGFQILYVRPGLWVTIGFTGLLLVLMDPQYFG